MSELAGDLIQLRAVPTHSPAEHIARERAPLRDWRAVLLKRTVLGPSLWSLLVEVRNGPLEVVHDSNLEAWLSS